MSRFKPLVALVCLSGALMNAGGAQTEPNPGSDTVGKAASLPTTRITQDDSVRTAIRAHMEEAVSLRESMSDWATDSAIVLCVAAQTLAEQHFGPNDTAVASAMYQLAMWNMQHAAWKQTDSLLLAAIAIWEAAVGPDHPSVGQTVHGLAWSYYRQGRLGEVEPLCLRAIALLETAPPEYRYHLANTLNTLGLLTLGMGRTAAADSLFLRSIEVFQSTDRGRLRQHYTRINLASSYQRQGRFDEAEDQYVLALKAMERELGPDHFDIHYPLKFLALHYRQRGDYGRSAVAIQRAAAIVEKKFGPKNWYLAYVLSEQAQVEFARGNHLEGVALHERAVAIIEESLGPHHIHIAHPLIQLAQGYAALGDVEQADVTYRLGLDARQAFIETTFPYASEEDKLSFVRENPLIVNSYVSFALQNESPEILKSALQMIVRGKARVLDAVSAERAIAYCSDDVELQQNLEQHARVCSEIANLALANLQGSQPNILRDSLQQLYELKNQVEASLSSRCEDFKIKLAANRFPVTEIAAALPEAGVLWEIISYRPFEFDRLGTKEAQAAPRYMAFVLDNTGSITATSLGDVSSIDSLVLVYRAEMQKAAAELSAPNGDEVTAEERLSEITRQLYRLVVAPLQNSNGSAGKIFVSPDAGLCLLPFELLQDADGQYLVEKHQISYLSSARDLLKFDELETPGSHYAVVMADPDYTAEPESAPRPPFAMLQTIGADFAYRGPSDRSQCLNTLFGALPATRIEGDKVADLLGGKESMQVDRQYGTTASEATLRSLETPPAILHLATHGYYCAGASFTHDSGSKEDPLLYTGLALAGANRLIMGTSDVDSTSDDGILTSLEASGLNLIGTELVVLSACQTGVGDVISGEGVYGLRRAFQLAGARTVVMSMFAVPDQSTVTLMERFYENWLSGQPKAAALRSAQLSMIRERREAHGAAHPLFWGGFILVGDPN